MIDDQMGVIVVSYQYRCQNHGILTHNFPIGHAPERIECEDCTEFAGRYYSAPMTSRAPANRLALIDKAEKSRDEPEVVSSLPRRHPSKRTPMAPPNPALQRLPRP